jgi:hypothetical protein
MKKQSMFLATVTILVCCSASKADVTSAVWNLGSLTNLNCTSQNFAGSTLGANAVQHAGLARMGGEIWTDTVLDPTLTLNNAVNNDTGFMWIGYQVNVVMTVPFSFTVPGPTVNNPPTGDWVVAAVVPPAFQVSGPWAGFYEGTLDFSAGSPIGIGGELDFLYSIDFASSTHYLFTQEMIPMFAPVPEPGTVALLGIGGLGLAVLRRNRRKGA